MTTFITTSFWNSDFRLISKCNSIISNSDFKSAQLLFHKPGEKEHQNQLFWQPDVLHQGDKPLALTPWVSVVNYINYLNSKVWIALFGLHIQQFFGTYYIWHYPMELKQSTKFSQKEAWRLGFLQLFHVKGGKLDS